MAAATRPRPAPFAAWKMAVRLPTLTAAVTPVLVEHTVPTTGFVIHDGETGFVFSGDTGPTKRIWQIAREMRGCRLRS